MPARLHTPCALPSVVSLSYGVGAAPLALGAVEHSGPSQQDARVGCHPPEPPPAVARVDELVELGAAVGAGHVAGGAVDLQARELWGRVGEHASVSGVLLCKVCVCQQGPYGI